MASREVRKVSLTGSTTVGQQMVRDAAATMKRVSMELGGNAPVIVFPDANLDATLDLAVPTKFANAGQVCVSPDRFYVHESVHDDFVVGLRAPPGRAEARHGLDETTQMGPLINQRRVDAIERVVEDARKRGGTFVHGGSRPAGENKGHFFAPTVITGLPDDALALAEENFGPIAAITPFRDAEEVYERANASEHRAGRLCLTRDHGAGARGLLHRIEAGMVGINSFALAAAEAPFGGIKQSGMGREGGAEGILDYLNVKLTQAAV